MKKLLITLLMAMLAVMMFTACGSNEPAEETDPIKETPAVDEEEKTESLLTVGREYILKDDMKVRKEPSTDSAQLKTSELSDEDKGKALDYDEAVLAKGAIVECLEADGYWIKISSGWICGYEKGRIYLIDTEFEEGWEKQKADFYEKVGIDQNSSQKLSGTYSVSGESGADSVEFFEDGECAVHFSTPMTPMTDKEGYTNGYYAVSGSKVYMNYGGSVYAELYELSGETLTQTSEKINVMEN